MRPLWCDAAVKIGRQRSDLSLIAPPPFPERPVARRELITAVKLCAAKLSCKVLAAKRSSQRAWSVFDAESTSSLLSLASDFSRVLRRVN